jgi:bifunctional lysine-specific demethylase and histidyl-hydroxylase NO66
MAELTAAPTVEPSEVATVEQTAAPMAELTVEQTAEQTAEPMGVQTAGPMVAQTVAPLAEDSVLSRLIAVDRNQFASQYWGRQPLLSPAADLPGGFPQLFDANAIDELVSQRGLRTPFLRVAKNGTTLGDKAFTSPGGVGAGIADQVSEDRLVRLFADGSTLVLQALHRVWPPILQFCQELAAELGHPVQANAYVTPPQNQGFSAHYDVHDVFVLQIAGEKRWRVHPPVLVSPLRDQPWNDRKADVEKRAEEPPLIEAVLTPGDSLYLPRGYLHAATALGGVSTHLTLGIHVWTRFALAQQVIEQALRTVSDDPVIRASLPLGVDVSDPSEMSPDFDVVTAILADAVENADLDQMSQSLLQNARLSQRAAPVGPLRQLHDADAITVDTQIALRRHLAASVDHSGSQILVRSRAGDLPVAEDDVGRLKALLTDGVATAGDLGVDLARRLLLAGLAIVE